MIFSAFSGLASGLSLIVAIGAQNAFVLRQGILRSHVLLVVAVCAVSDLLLIVLGVAGIGVLIERAPAVLDVVRWAGAAFLLGYGGLAAARAIRGGPLAQPGVRPRAPRDPGPGAGGCPGRGYGTPNAGSGTGFTRWIGRVAKNLAQPFNLCKL